MALFEKIVRRSRHLLMRCVQWLRVLFYQCISTNPVKGKPRRYQPLQCAGMGNVSIDDGVSIGVFPSPFFFSTYAYIEARHPAAIVTIGAGTWLNNNFCAIAEHTCIKIGKNCRIGDNVIIKGGSDLPREDNDNYSIIEGISDMGRATVEQLKLNRTGVVNLRRALFLVGVHPPQI